MVFLFLVVINQAIEAQEWEWHQLNNNYEVLNSYPFEFQNHNDCAETNATEKSYFETVWCHFSGLIHPFRPYFETDSVFVNQLMQFRLYAKYRGEEWLDTERIEQFYFVECVRDSVLYKGYMNSGSYVKKTPFIDLHQRGRFLALQYNSFYKVRHDSLFIFKFSNARNQLKKSDLNVKKYLIRIQELKPVNSRFYFHNISFLDSISLVHGVGFLIDTLAKLFPEKELLITGRLSNDEQAVFYRIGNNYFHPARDFELNEDRLLPFRLVKYDVFDKNGIREDIVSLDAMCHPCTLTRVISNICFDTIFFAGHDSIQKDVRLIFPVFIAPGQSAEFFLVFLGRHLNSRKKGLIVKKKPHKNKPGEVSNYEFRIVSNKGFFDYECKVLFKD